MINRKELIRRHNPVLNSADTESPLAVGNGELAFTADITGLQTLYGEYNSAPLCTMSSWGWHTISENGARYTLDDVEMTHYECGGRHFEYAVECSEGNEDVYNWLRRNPHRLNLARISLLWNGSEISASKLLNTRQALDLYTGILTSEFELCGNHIAVTTACAKSADVLGFSITSPAVENGYLTVQLSFPYGSHRISASDWDNPVRHTSSVLKDSGTCTLLERNLDGDRYFVLINGVSVEKTGEHKFILRGSGSRIEFTASFAPDAPKRSWDYDGVYSDSVNKWSHYWETVGIADFSGAKDNRSHELERRMVLSLYLTAVHCAGSMPPQETGLACNSWYGKFHLEMHILHAGCFPLWGHGELLEKSFEWYLGILDNARKNAARNGFKGARWPKMTGPEGFDSPSRIATLLIWQQPHILYMLELIRFSLSGISMQKYMRKYWTLVSETADFMCDFPRHNEKTGNLELSPPLIPAQEEHAPENVVNPVFELCYWRFGLEVAIRWARELSEPCALWEDVLARLSEPPVIDGLYPAHQNCHDTFTAFNRDHPSMLFGYGFIPCEHIDKRVMSDTADRVWECWNWSTAWGWDFALTAMTLTRLGRPEAAIDALLYDTPKNSYVASGNNYQRGRDDLPLYLPGNGSLLMALAMMLAGYGKARNMPGFPKNGMWDGVEFEGISPLPY